MERRTHINSLEKCTSCGKQLGDFKILVQLNFSVYRKKLSDEWENVDNSNLSSNEVVCRECFSKLVDSIDAVMNKQEKLDV